MSKRMFPVFESHPHDKNPRHANAESRRESIVSLSVPIRNTWIGSELTNIISERAWWEHVSTIYIIYCTDRIGGRNVKRMLMWSSKTSEVRCPSSLENDAILNFRPGKKTRGNFIELVIATFSEHDVSSRGESSSLISEPRITSWKFRFAFLST